MGDFKFDPMGFVDSLYYMGIGMLCIFIVIALIIIITILLNTCFDIYHQQKELREMTKANKKE